KSEEVIERNYLFGGAKERWTYGNVKRIAIKATFGGAELDLRRIKLSDGVDTVRITVAVSFGGISLSVPADWNIVINQSGAIGGFSDNRSSSISRPTTGKTVILDLTTSFGGCEIK
ncbi:MAG: cell wall-active antibiotics response protein, partial [Tannerella sp.]|nr:cell wall-active antibiotics response protein [Tannerella sp.]